SPAVMLVTSVRESDKEACIGNSFHAFEKPLRVERSRGRLRTLPARRINFLVLLSLRRTRSSCSRTICPCDIPVRADFSWSQLARDFGTRMVIVLLIRHNCNTHLGKLSTGSGKRRASAEGYGVASVVKTDVRSRRSAMSCSQRRTNSVRVAPNRTRQAIMRVYTLVIDCRDDEGCRSVPLLLPCLKISLALATFSFEDSLMSKRAPFAVAGFLALCVPLFAQQTYRPDLFSALNNSISLPALALSDGHRFSFSGAV